MGFFDRFAAKKPNGSPLPPAALPESAPETVAGPAAQAKAKLLAAREKLGAKDLPGAMAIYEELLSSGAGDRADVLVTISGDLGSHGHVAEIIELVAPRYDAGRHGPATGLNLLQAYLAVRDASAAQHVLDILFSLNRPELEDRLHGFSNAIAELMTATDQEVPVAGGAPGRADGAPKIGLITISKPIWFYGLEPLAAQILPPKDGRLRRIAFAQLALPGRVPEGPEGRRPEDEIGRLTRGIPLWLAETFYFSPLYAPVTAVAFKTPAGGQEGNHHVAFGAEWTTENLRQLVETSGEGIDYIITGALREVTGDHELTLRIWEVKNYRERKAFTVRWTPATADAALLKIHGELRAYREWSPASAAYAYTVPAQPLAWIDTLGASLGLFLVEKNVLPADQLAPVEEDLRRAAARAAQGEAQSLAFLTLRARAARLGSAAPKEEVTLARSSLVTQARQALA